MAIRWKSFSSSDSIKTILVILFTLSITVLVTAYRFIELDANAEYAIEALYEQNYVNSIKHKNEVVKLFEWIGNVVDSSGKDAENAKRMLEHTEYLYRYETNEDEKAFNYNNDNLSLATYPCLYEWNPDEGMKLGSDTNGGITEWSLPKSTKIKSIKVACPREVFKKKELEWTNLHRKVVRACIFMSISALFSIISLIWLFVVAGTGYQAKKRFHGKKGGLFTELQIAIGVIAVWYFIYGDAKIWKGMGQKEGRMVDFEQIVSAAINGAIAGACGLLLLYSAMSVVAKIRNGTFYKTSLLSLLSSTIGKSAKKLMNEVKGILTGEAFYQSGVAKSEWNRLIAMGSVSFVALIALIVTVVFGLVPFIALATLVIVASAILYWWGGYRRIKDYAKVDKQIDDIYTGNYNAKSEIKEDSPYYETSKKMSSIGDGIQMTLEEKIKSERMKIELVTNVSHDLKTPLTSIISYVDLLAREEGLSKEAKDYVSILMKKSARLKEIVSDVFELAKTTSGEIKVKINRIDFHKLIVQTLADMEDKIQNMGLTVRLNMPEGPVYVRSDGKRLYRVLQNLIDNTLKYSLRGTRIYVDLTVEGEQAVIVVKNTANYEMTFTKEDILERFFRADKARTTEGSGLGISIAHAFVVACGGEMDVEIDGDMFKVILTFQMDGDAKNR